MFFNKDNDAGLLLLRIAVGGLLVMHGLRKLEKPKETIDHMEDVLEDKNLPTVMSNGVFVGEVVAPAMLIIGYRTRLAASVVAFNMLTAIYTVNLPKIDEREDNGAWGLEVQAFYLIGAAALFFTGGGNYAASTNSLWD